MNTKEERSYCGDKESWTKPRQGFVPVKIYFCQNTDLLSRLPVFFAWGGTLVRNGKTFEFGKTEKSLDASVNFILSK